MTATAERSTAAIECSGLGKRYGKTWALRDCTLSLPEGRVVALIGPNGAGKTTFLSLVMGLAEATEGTVLVDGHPAGGPEALARVAFMGQDHPLYKWFTVADHLRMGHELNAGFDLRGPAPGRVTRTSRCSGPPGGYRAASRLRSPSRSPWPSEPRSSCLTSPSPAWTR